jgi:uroporphyrinogen decarboxylase
MTDRQLLKNILAHKSDHNGFWHGNPHPDSMPAYQNYFKVKNDYELSRCLGDTFTWVMPEACQCWQHPDNKPMFDIMGGKIKHSLNEGGVFASCEDIAEVDRFPWPETRHLDFSQALAAVDRAERDGTGILSGMWSPFFHIAADFFGMDNYFIKMYTNPEIVDAVTERIVQFYLDANELWLDLVADRIDAIFFGNDFGSQLDLLISPALFERFVMPYFVRFTEQAKQHGLRVVLHSCGAIDRAIPYLIDAGVDALHPIQALAKDMDAISLARKYQGKITFIGGVDTQQLLPFGTPQEVRDEVHRLRDIFGPNYIVSPSHEALLPNVSPENLAAMAEAALD